jgi:hypothetical protein
MGGQAQVDAVVGRQVGGRERFAASGKAGLPATTMRSSGPMRTAIMSFATRWPMRTPAS